jgi:hypothetical protein
MKKLLIIYTVVGACVIAAYFPFKENKLIIEYHRTDNICRGEDPNQKSTQFACDQRDNISNKLLKQGVCWGHKDQAEYQKTWEICNLFLTHRKE